VLATGGCGRMVPRLARAYVGLMSEATPGYDDESALLPAVRRGGILALVSALLSLLVTVGLGFDLRTSVFCGVAAITVGVATVPFSLLDAWARRHARAEDRDLMAGMDGCGLSMFVMLGAFAQFVYLSVVLEAKGDLPGALSLLPSTLRKLEGGTILMNAAFWSFPSVPVSMAVVSRASVVRQVGVAFLTSLVSPCLPLGYESVISTRNTGIGPSPLWALASLAPWPCLVIGYHLAGVVDGKLVAWFERAE